MNEVGFIYSRCVFINICRPCSWAECDLPGFLAHLPNMRKRVSEAIAEFVHVLPPLNEDDTTQDRAKHHENIKKIFPFLGKITSLGDIAVQTGSLKIGAKISIFL